MRALIIGGGIGGLTLALALHRKGNETTVFEQSAQIRELGVGVNTLPHAIKELAELGLLEALDAVGIRTEELIYKTASGQEILRQPRGIAAGLDYPQFSIHRGKLQSLLHNATVQRLGAEKVKTGAKLVRFRQNQTGVAAAFEDRKGRRWVEHGDVLIGADGIHSTVRRAYRRSPGQPSWNGILMWRGATWTDPFLTGRSMIIAGGMKAKLVLYPIFNDPEGRPGKTLMNWVVCAKLGDGSTPMPSRDDWSKKGELADVMPHVEGVLHLDEVDIPAMIRATPEFYVYPMCDRVPLKRWSHGRVTLLGDAAHPMYPVGSNGASQAILDAVCLSDLLAEASDPADALAAYDAVRRPATSAIVRANRKGGPERVIDLVEERAPDGFASLDDVATPDELTAIVGAYQRMAGFSAKQVNRKAG
ncbi:MAG: flavin-dependent oxidoreductase [Pseudomonadota bacterium]